MARAAFAVRVSTFQLNMANFLSSLILSGVLERYPGIRVVFGETGVGWFPYVLSRIAGRAVERKAA